MKYIVYRQDSTGKYKVTTAKLHWQNRYEVDEIVSMHDTEASANENAERLNFTNAQGVDMRGIYRNRL